MNVATERIAELSKARDALIQENDEITTSVKTEDGTIVIEDKQSQAFRANLATIKSYVGEIDALREQEDIRAGLEAPERPSAAQAAAAEEAKGLDISKMGRKTVGQAFIESKEFRTLIESGGAQMQNAFELKGNIGDKWLETKDVYTDLPSGSPNTFGSIQWDEFVTRGERTNRVRDLFPVQQTSAQVIEFFRSMGYNTAVAGHSTNAASMVPERDAGAFGLKPQTSLKYEGVTVPTRTLAHWEAAHRNVLSDEPQLRGIIDNELLYGLRLVEDDQILNGTGTGQDLTGILNDTGIQTYAQSSGPGTDTAVDAIRRAMTKAFLAYYAPTGIVCHPNNWEEMELDKDANERYLVAVSVALGGEQRLWRVPLVDTPAIGDNIALVGAFGLGASLYDREEASIRIAEQHASFFIQNAIAILAEERLVLAIKRPESFVKVTLT